jgi:hypothetical protein
VAISHFLKFQAQAVIKTLISSPTKYSHSKAAAVFHKIVKLVKNGVLMIIPIYAKVSNWVKIKFCHLPIFM